MCNTSLYKQAGSVEKGGWSKNRAGNSCLISFAGPWLTEQTRLCRSMLATVPAPSEGTPRYG